MQPLDSKRLEKEVCSSVSSHHGADTKLLEMLADDPRSYMPPTDAGRHRSAAARVVYRAQDRPDLGVLACTLGKTMAHSKLKMKGTRLRPERLHPLCVHGGEGGRFTLVLHAAVHKRGSRKQGENVVFRPTRRFDGGCKETHSKTTAEEAGFNARRCVATDLRLQSVCLIDRDQRLMQRVCGTRALNGWPRWLECETWDRSAQGAHIRT